MMAGSVGGVAQQRDWSGLNPTRYPDPDIVVLDPKFKKYFRFRKYRVDYRVFTDE